MTLPKEFYDDVCGQSHVAFAVALQKIREHAYTGDPKPGLTTYAAYCFYGDPLATPAQLIPP
jgi:hypothetical protein